MEKQANKNLMNFKERQCEALPLQRNNPMHLHRQEADQMESSSANKK